MGIIIHKEYHLICDANISEWCISGSIGQGTMNFICRKDLNKYAKCYGWKKVKGIWHCPLCLYKVKPELFHPCVQVPSWLCLNLFKQDCNQCGGSPYLIININKLNNNNVNPFVNYGG